MRKIFNGCFLTIFNNLFYLCRLQHDMGLYSEMAEISQFVVPNLYKRRYFKRLENLSQNNFVERKAEPELVWLRSFLPQDAVVLDVGANVGAYLFIFEKFLLPENIYAFEPNPKLYKRLLRIFKDIKISPVALSNKNETAAFKIPMMHGKEIASRGTLQTNLKEEGESSQKIENVKVMKLDEWTAENHLTKIDFIKIDVEGNEFATLRGAEKTIKNHRPTLMVEMEQRHHETPLWDFIEEIEGWNFVANYLDRTDFTLKKLTREFLEKQDASQVKNHQNYINNIIFIPAK